MLTFEIAQIITQPINSNYETLKTQISDQLESYNNLVITADTIKEGKSKKSLLNKLKKAINDKRIEVKNIYMQPYEDFKNNMDTLIEMIDQSVLSIDSQVKVFDDVKKEEKRKSIEYFYQTNIKSLMDLLPLEKIWNDRWLNTTYSFMQISQEIMGIIEKTKTDIATIKAMKLGFENEILSKYLVSLDISVALATITKIQQEQANLKQYEISQNQTNNISNIPQLETKSKVQNLPHAEVDELVQIDFRVWVSPMQKQLLREFLVQNNIKYGGTN